MIEQAVPAYRRVLSHIQAAHEHHTQLLRGDVSIHLHNPHSPKKNSLWSPNPSSDPNPPGTPTSPRSPPVLSPLKTDCVDNSLQLSVKILDLAFAAEEKLLARARLTELSADISSTPPEVHTVWCGVVYCAVVYCTVLYYTVLYCTL